MSAAAPAAMPMTAPLASPVASATASTVSSAVSITPEPSSVVFSARSDLNRYFFGATAEAVVGVGEARHTASSKENMVREYVNLMMIMRLMIMNE